MEDFYGRLPLMGTAILVGGRGGVGGLSVWMFTSTVLATGGGS